MVKHFASALSLFLAGATINSQELTKSKDNAHEGGANAVAISNDGSMILTGGNDMKSYLWNSKTLDKLKGGLKHNEKVTAVAINSNNKYYATGCTDMKTRIMDIEQGLPVRILSEHTGAISAVIYNPVTDFIATASADNTVKIWDNNLKNKTSLFTLKGHTKEVKAIVFSPDGKNLASGALDNSIKIWDVSTGALKNTLDGGSKSITSLAFGSDGKYLLSGSTNGSVTIWDPYAGTIMSELTGCKYQINSVAFSPDCQYAAAAGNNKKITIWKVETGKLEKEFVAHEGGNINGIAFSDKGDVLVSVSGDGSMKIWDVSALKIGGKKFVKSGAGPALSCSTLTLKDANSNGILEGGEKANLAFTIKNKGSGAAFNILVRTTLETPVSQITFDKEVAIGNLEAGKSQAVTIPLTVAEDLEGGRNVFNVEIVEANGFNPSPLTLGFQTGALGSYNYIMISGNAYSSATGKAEIGAPITLKLKVKNLTKGEAKNIKVKFLLPDHVLAVSKLSELIPSMAAGEEKEITMDFYADKNFTQPEIKMGLDIDGAAFTNAKDMVLRVKMNDKLPTNEDFSSDIVAQAAKIEEQPLTESHPQMRGGGDPLKGINVASSKSMIIGNYYLLVIGIDKYKGQWPQLTNAVNDAKAVEKSMKLSYKFDQIHALYNEQATRDNIIKEMEWLVATVKEQDNVFIYYSGHGEYKKELSKGFWVPVDAESESTSKFISNSDLQTYVSGIKSKHTLLIADACFSGDIFRGNTITVPFEESEKYYREVNSLASRQALTSGGIEPVMDGGKEGHSVFAYYLLKTLADNQSKYFDAGQLFSKVKIPVINNSEQTPKFSPIKNAGDEGGQFIFIKK